MRLIYFLLVLTITFNSLSEEGRLGRESNDFKYASIGIDLIQSDKTGIGVMLSFELPGPLYAVLERKAEGVDSEEDSYDRIINGARLGAQVGIGDLISNISASGINVGVKKYF